VIPAWQWAVAVLAALVVAGAATLLLGPSTADLDRLAAPAPGPGEADECLVDASCTDTPEGHSYSWPCVWAPGTGRRWLAEHHPHDPRVPDRVMARINKALPQSHSAALWAINREDQRQ
jgi:hypothetical protein